MTELLSALTTALETCLPERVARGETSVDQFFDAEGFSLDELSREIEQVVSCHTEWKTLLEQRGNDPRAVFRDQQLLNGLIAIVSKETEDEAVVMSAGGLGRKIQAGNLTAIRSSLSKTNRGLDTSRRERADSLAEREPRGDLMDRVEGPRVETSHSGIKQEYSNHEQEMKDYSRLYAAGRKELGKVTIKTLELDVAKQIVRYQINRFVSGYQKSLASNKRSDWASAGKDGLGGYSAEFGYKGGYAMLEIDNYRGQYNETWDVSFSYSKGGIDKNVYLWKIVGGDWTLEWEFSNKGKMTKQGDIDFSNKDVYERTKAFQRDQAIVQAHHQGDLIPEAVKKKFGRILALSAVAYNMKRRIAIEKQYWPKTYSKIIDLTKKGDWGKAYQYNQALTDLPVRQLQVSNQKRDAEALRMLYGAQLAVNRSVKDAWTNADRVYKRALLDGLSAKQAKRFGALTYVSDLVLFDSFIASSDLSRIASSRVSCLTGAEKELTLMTYALMPFVIRRQLHDSRHIYNLERMGGSNSKIASDLLTYDLFKNQCLTKTLHYGYSQYEQYLGFDPVHRILRHTKHTIQKATSFLDKWVFDPLIGGAVRLVTFNQFSGKDLQKAFNGSLSFAESIGFAMVKGVVHLPKHIYKDTKELSHQLGRVLTGQSTWKGSWDALGRDTKGPRKVLRFGFNVSPAGWIWHKAHGNSDPIFQKWGNLFNAARVGISAARHVAQIKKDMALAHVEIRLHQQLHQWRPEQIDSPYQLAKSNYPRAFKKFNSDLKVIESKLVQGLVAQINPRLIGKLTIDMTMHKKPTLTSQQQAQIQADRASIANKIKNYDPKNEISKILFSNTTALKKQFKAIHEREISRFRKQVKLLEYAHAHRQTLDKDLIRAEHLVKVQQSIINAKKSLNSQIQSDWSSGGEKLFRHLFIYPISNNIPLKNRSKAVNTEISDIQNFYQSRNLGEKVFADILLGDLVARLLHDTPVVIYAKTAVTRLDATLFGKSIMRLIKWDTSGFVSRMRFVFSVAQISVNEADVQKITSAVKDRSLAIIQSSSFKAFVDNHAWAADDLTWYTKNSSKGYFGKSWKKRISNDAQKNSNGTAAAWQMDVKEIKNGQTLTVGHIVNSLEPSGDSWGLTLRTPAKPEPVPPGPNSNPAPGPSKNGSHQLPSDLVSVNLMGFNAHYHSAKKLYKKAFGKKTDPIKDEAKAVKEDAETDIDTAIDDVEKDVAHDVECTVEDIVDTDIVDTEALIADAEIDILA